MENGQEVEKYKKIYKKRKDISTTYIQPCAVLICSNSI